MKWGGLERSWKGGLGRMGCKKLDEKIGCRSLCEREGGRGGDRGKVTEYKKKIIDK